MTAVVLAKLGKNRESDTLDIIDVGSTKEVALFLSARIWMREERRMTL